MAIVANVKDGVLNYGYTDSSKKEQVGSNLGYDQFLQLLCAEMQYQDPLEPTTNTEYVAQMATFSQLEATLSLQETEKNALASSLTGKQVILATQDQNGNTKYVEGRVDYVLYQNGEVFLSVNDGLYPLSTLDTVADDGYYEAANMSNTFSGMMSKFPNMDNITASYKGAIQEARDFYESMSDYQKRFVKATDLAKLAQLEEKVAELVKLQEIQQKNEAANQAAATEEKADDTVENAENTVESEGIVNE